MGEAPVGPVVGTPGGGAGGIEATTTTHQPAERHREGGGGAEEATGGATGATGAGGAVGRRLAVPGQTLVTAGMTREDLRGTVEIAVFTHTGDLRVSP